MWTHLSPDLLDEIDAFLCPDFKRSRSVCRKWRFRKFSCQQGLALCLELARAQALIAKFKQRDRENIAKWDGGRVSDVSFAIETPGFDSVY
jgi:hypothetical protein